MAAKRTKRQFGLRIPKNGATYYFRFRVNGKQIEGSTGTDNYQEALRVASLRYAEEIAEKPLITREKRRPTLTLDAAFARYYEEWGSQLKSEVDVLRALDKIADGLGPQKCLSHISLGDLMQYQARRREDGVKNRTINYEIPETIRPVVKRASRWGIDTGELGKLNPDDWNALKLPIDAPRVRSLSTDERATLFAKLREDYQPIILFALLTGLRKSAFFIKRDQLDWENEILWYAKKSKLTNDRGYLPITRQMAVLLKEEIAKGGDDCQWVFTYESASGQGRQPITPAGLTSHMRRVVKNAKLKDWRLFHDLRHTAATDLLRACRNMAIVQRVLSHGNITQTMRYAHVLADDLRQGMESVG